MLRMIDALFAATTWIRRIRSMCSEVTFADAAPLNSPHRVADSGASSAIASTVRVRRSESASAR